MKPRILVLAVGMFAIGTDGFVVASVLPGIAHSLDASVGNAGLLVTAFALTYGLTAPVLTAGLARYPRRTILVVAMAGLAVTNFVAAAAPNTAVIFFARILAAVAAGAYSPAALATAVQVSPPEQRARAVATVLTGLTSSLVLGVPLGSLLGSLGSWRWTFILVGCLAAMAAAGVRVMLPPVEPMQLSSLRARLTLLRRPAMAANLAAAFVWLTGAMILYTFIALVVARATGWGGSAISALLLLYGGAAFLGNWIGGRASDRWGGKRCVVAGLATTLPAFALMGYGTQVGPPIGIVWCLLSLTVWGVAGWSLTPSQSHRLIAAAPAAGADILSLNTSAIYLGTAAGAALGGRIVAHLSLADLGYVAALLQAVSLIIVGFTPIRATSPTETAASSATAVPT